MTAAGVQSRCTQHQVVRVGSPQGQGFPVLTPRLAHPASLNNPSRLGSLYPGAPGDPGVLLHFSPFPSVGNLPHTNSSLSPHPSSSHKSRPPHTHAVPCPHRTPRLGLQCPPEGPEDVGSLSRSNHGGMPGCAWVSLSSREALGRGCVPSFPGNLSRLALNLRQEAGSGYQEWG